MPSSTDPKPAYGQRWDWEAHGIHSRLMLICPANDGIGTWQVLFLHDESKHLVGRMSGLYEDRPPISGYTYIEG